ncbi:MAG: hypothetical protein M0Z51_08140 [Propionibacterium sp.]|nr:hypothetical protein [Propionibacterium sp.]
MTSPGFGDARGQAPIPGLVHTFAPGADAPGPSARRVWQSWSPDVTPPAEFQPRRQEISSSDRVGETVPLSARAGTWTLTVIAGRIAASWVDQRPGQGTGRAYDNDLTSGSTVVVPAGVACSYQVLEAPVHLSMLFDAQCDSVHPPADRPFRILFVCTANICRSAYAHLAANGRPHAGLEFGSAGVHALVGRPIDPPMADCLDPHLDPSSHRARQLTRADMVAADLVLTMAAEHRRYILEEWPDLGRKTFVLGHVARELQRAPDDLTLQDLAGHLWRRRTVEPDDDVPDPYGRGPRAARAAAGRIDESLDVVLRVLGTLSASSPDGT